MRTDFVNLVAQNRNLDPKVVRDTEAMCYNAQDAKAIGLIDAVTTPMQAVAEFLNGPSDGSEQSGANAMSFTQEEMDAARQEAAAQATTAERTRIAGIMGCEAAANRPNLASHLAFKTSMTVAEAGDMLVVSAEEKSAAAPAAPAAPANPAAAKGDSPFDNVMANAQHPNAGADAGQEGTQEDKETAGLMAAAKSVAGEQWA
jgi:ClpP class serine protease